MDDIAAIKQLKYRYLRAIDTKAWDDLADTVTVDVIANYGEEGHNGGSMSFSSCDDLIEFLRASLTESVITEHRVNHPEITVDGDEATGSWYLFDRVFMLESNSMLIGSSFYTDHYRRTADGWRIRSTGFKRTYEATVSLADLPSFSLKIGAALPF